jgi:hypothetical protein
MMIKKNLFKNQDADSVFVGISAFEGAVKGGLIGAGVGAIGGYLKAKYDIKQTPVETVKLTYKEPIYVKKEIGKIPEDEYIGKSVLQDSDIENIVKNNNSLTKPVIENVPVRDESGKIVYKEINKEFSGHGKPVVEYKTEEVKDPVFEGYGWEVRGHAHAHCSNDSGTAHVSSYSIKFYPKIRYNVVDTYHKPEVKFENGVNILRYVSKGLWVGMVVGAVAGAIVGALTEIYND